MSNEMTSNEMTPDEIIREQPGELCREAQHYLHQYVEGELDPIRSSLIREHLKACAACQKEREALEAERLWFLEAVVDAPLLSGRFQEKILEKVRKAKRQAALQRLLGRAGSFAAAFLVIGLTAIQFQRTSDDHPLPPRSSGRARTVTSATCAPTPAGLEVNHTPLLVCGSDCSEPDSSNPFSPLTDRIDHARLASGGPPFSRAGARTASIFVAAVGVTSVASFLEESLAELRAGKPLQAGSQQGWKDGFERRRVFLPAPYWRSRATLARVQGCCPPGGLPSCRPGL